MFSMKKMWNFASIGSTIASIVFFEAMLERCLPEYLRVRLQTFINRIVGFFNPHIQIMFHEYTGEYYYHRSEIYTAIRNYLSIDSSKKAKRLKAELFRDSKKLVLSMDDYEEITERYGGAQVRWIAGRFEPRSDRNFDHRDDNIGRYYKLKFHKKHRELVTELYLNHVMDQGKKIGISKRQRKLYTNNKSDAHNYWHKTWSHVIFDHPATFRTLAMDPEKKEEILDDLVTFRQGKAYYEKIGKAWKRGYLLYGPPGTGKSTMIAAMANLLEYDIYDLELTTVKDNSELRRLLIGIKSKSIVVIEDIDCSLHLTGQRKQEVDEDEDEDEDDDDDEKTKAKKVTKEDKPSKDSKVTLSGLLNFIDGLWSSCGGERLIVFTTNHVDKLDPALIRRGRMDKHIELAYCTFEGFKVLAKNYLDLDLHPLFDTICQLLNETQMTPADVAENLTPKRSPRNVETCLESLIEALKNAKEQARLKAEEEKQKEIRKEKKKKGESPNKEETKEKARKVEEDGKKGASQQETKEPSNKEETNKKAEEKEERESSSREETEKESRKEEEETKKKASKEEQETKKEASQEKTKESSSKEESHKASK